MKKRYYILIMVVAIWLVLLWNFPAVTFVFSLPFLALIGIYAVWTIGLLLFNAITGIPITKEDAKNRDSKSK